MPKPEPKHKHLPYRPEVDGLRALAVVPVVLFHAGFKIFGGGFVGVDVFFVISGFLITSIILAEMRAGTFTLRHFYERRVRRILPALFVVMACCLVPAWLWMLPEQLKQFGHSLVAVPLFSSNILFLKETAYFAPSALEKPLLHTWSLAVEEQYYVVFPLLVFLLYRFGLKILSTVLAIIAAASLWYSQHQLMHDPVANFYLAHTRAWELLAGALFAIASIEKPLPERVGKSLAEILSACGFLIILASIFFYSEATLFPGLTAVPPVFGAVLVLGFANKNTLTGKILSLRPVVAMGLISYSFYLWHQPVFAFARLYAIGAPTSVFYIILCTISLWFSYLTWRFVENPIRNKEKYTSSQIFTGAVILSLCFMSLGYTARLTKGFPERFDRAQLAMLIPASSKIEELPFKALPELKEIRYLHLGKENIEPDTVLLGDSHAGAISEAFDQKLKKENRAAVFLTNSACESIPNTYSSRALDRTNRDCPAWQEKLVDYIKQDPAIKNIVIVMRWTYRLYPIKGEIESLTYDNGEGGIEADDYREYYALDKNGKFTQDGADKSRTVREFLEGLVHTGKNIIVLYPIPEAGWNIPQLNHKNMMRGKRPDMISTSYDRFLARNKYAKDLLDSFAAPNLVRIHPSDVLCNIKLVGRCVAQMGDTPLYFDDDHLSAAGSELVVNQIMPALR